MHKLEQEVDTQPKGNITNPQDPEIREVTLEVE